MGKVSMNQNKKNMNSTPDTTSIGQWSSPQRVEVNEYEDRIEMVYKETSMVTYLDYQTSNPPEERVFKIVFSCKNGKWNKSERVYWQIVRATEEAYIF